MPNAFKFGLTGTPIELNDRHTPKAFGQEIGPDRLEWYMDRYSRRLDPCRRPSG